MNEPRRYQLAFRPAAARSLRKLSSSEVERIKVALEGSRQDPRPPDVKALSGEAGLWRARVGDYRVVYEIEDDALVVMVVRVAHRRALFVSERTAQNHVQHILTKLDFSRRSQIAVWAVHNLGTET